MYFVIAINTTMINNGPNRQVYRYNFISPTVASLAALAVLTANKLVAMYKPVAEDCSGSGD